MTDLDVMEADCIHGLVWYECKECIPDAEPIEVMKEVLGIQYCKAHGGIMVEGDDERCKYEEMESDADCTPTVLYFGAKDHT